jgi:hypothetical protein
MRVRNALLACSALLCFGASSPAAEPVVPALAEPVKLMAAGKPIEVDTGHASPCVFDINGDGKKDLLVGQFGGGKLRVYLNGGTDAEPKFDKFTYLQIDGTDATVPPS